MFQTRHGFLRTYFHGVYCMSGGGSHLFGYSFGRPIVHGSLDRSTYKSYQYSVSKRAIWLSNQRSRTTTGDMCVCLCLRKNKYGLPNVSGCCADLNSFRTAEAMLVGELGRNGVILTESKGELCLDFCSNLVVPCGGISGAGLAELGMILVATLCGCAVNRIAFVKMAWSAETK